MMGFSVELLLAFVLVSTAVPSSQVSSGAPQPGAPSDARREAPQVAAAEQSNTAELTCVDLEKKKGFPKQKLFVSKVDDERAGTIWSGLRKSVILQPGKRTVVIRHMASILYADYEFSVDAQPGKKYICTGRYLGKEVSTEILDAETGETVGEPIRASCMHVGADCVW